MRLHKKYGMNPTVPVCAYCGHDKNEVVCLGAGYDGEAPKNMLIDVRPCEDCAKKFSAGILIAETNSRTDATGDVKPIPPVYAYVVITREAFTKMFEGESFYDAAMEHGVLYTEKDVLTKMGLITDAD